MQGPAAFQRKALKRHLWSKQIEIVQAVHSKRSVAIKGCHASGKTFVLSGVVVYEMLSHPEIVVLVIAPTLRQVKNFWGEVRQAIDSLPWRFPEATTTRWELSPTCFAQGFSAAKGVNAQSFHGKRVVIIVDEAMGVSQDLWDAIDGIRMGGDVTLVTLCNPTVASGPVFDSFTKNSAVAGHKCITISAFDTPNLAGLTVESLLQLSEEDLDIAIAPGLTRRRAVKEMYYKWGPANPRFISRVLGDFPSQSSDAVFQLSWIERAGLPYEPEELAKLMVPGVFIQVGVDVAGPGDDETAATARIGQYVVSRGAWMKPDAVDEVRQFIGALNRRFPGVPILVLGDVVGIGWHFMTQIARYHRTYGFVAGAAPLNPVMFVNAKAEQYWCLREWMKEGMIHGIEDEDTKAQLSDVRYRETPMGRIEIESKDEARGRGSKSPDRAESLIMAFARIVEASQTVLIGDPGYQISPV